MKAPLLLRRILLCCLLAVGQRAVAEESYFTWVVSARLKEDAGDIAGAIADYDKAIALHPSGAEEYNARGALKQSLKDWAGAIADYDRGIALKPEHLLVNLYANRGWAKHESNDWAGALADYDAAITFKPDYALVYLNRGTIHLAQGRPAAALADCDRAIALEPDELEFYPVRAEARMANGDQAGASADYDRAVALNPKRAFTYYERGIFRRSINDLAGSLADFSKLVELRPNDQLGYLCLAVSRQAQGNLEEALADYSKAAEVDAELAAYPWPYREIVLRQLHRDLPFAEQARTVAGWPESWNKTIGLYLIGAITESEFVSRAGQGPADQVPPQQCMAYYFIGMMKLLGDDPAAARREFERCIGLGLSHMDEYILARAELDRLPAQP